MAETNEVFVAAGVLSLLLVGTLTPGTTQADSRIISTARSHPPPGIVSVFGQTAQAQAQARQVVI